MTDILSLLVLVGVIALVLRRWIDSYVVENLVKNEGVRPAAREVLAIATAGWRSRALWLLITGVVVIFAGWLIHSSSKFTIPSRICRDLLPHGS